VEPDAPPPESDASAGSDTSPESKSGPKSESRSGDADRRAGEPERIVTGRLEHALTLPVLGIPTRFETNGREVLEAVEETFGAWRVLDAHPEYVDAAPARVRIEIVPGGEGPHEHAPVRFDAVGEGVAVMTSPGSRGRADAGARLAEARVTEALARDGEHFRGWVVEGLALALLTRLDRQPLHAAAVARGGRALLLAGRGGVGKSTLTYAAHRAGLQVLSEDIVFVQLNAAPRVWAMPRLAHLLPDAARFFPELAGIAPVLRANGKWKIPVSLLPADGSAPPLPVADRVGICLLARGEGGPIIERVPPGEAVDALAGRLEPGFDLFASTIAARVRPLAERGAWRLILPPHPSDAVPALEAMLDELG
jgi:hypothetical protein